LGPTGLYGSNRDLEGETRTLQKTGRSAWAQVGEERHDPPPLVQKEDIQGETHSKHVDAPTGRKKQSLSGPESGSPQKSDQPRTETIGPGNAMAEAGSAIEVTNL